MNPTISDIKAGGFTSVRKETMRSLRERDKPRTVEIFRRDSDSTFWWTNSSHDGRDVDILQVEPVYKVKDGEPSTEVIAYHELRV